MGLFEGCALPSPTAYADYFFPPSVRCGLLHELLVAVNFVVIELVGFVWLPCGGLLARLHATTT